MRRTARRGSLGAADRRPDGKAGADPVYTGRALAGLRAAVLDGTIQPGRAWRSIRICRGQRVPVGCALVFGW